MASYPDNDPVKSSGTTDPLLQAWLYYYEPLETEVDLRNKKATALAIHDSAPSVQLAIDGVLADAVKGNFDRIALPDIADKTVNSTLPVEWAELLESKHHFEEIHVFESDGPHRRAARSLIKNVFPHLRVVVHKVDVDPERTSTIMAVQCADPRFQEQYRLMMEDRAPGSVYERLAMPGAELAITNYLEARGWTTDLINQKRIQTIYMLGHIDCAIAGGLPSHYNHEASEAEYHARAFHDATRIVKVASPGRVDVIPHMIASEGKIGVRDLQDSLGLVEE